MKYVMLCGLATAGLVLGGCGTAGPSTYAYATAVAASYTPTPVGGPAVVPPIGRVGAAVTSGGLAFTVHGVERRASYTGTVGQTYRARDGYVFVVLDVEVALPGRDAHTYTSAFVEVRDPAGVRYEPRSERSIERGLRAGPLVRDERARGLVPIELPVAVADAGGLVVTYGGVSDPGGRPLPLRVRVDVPA